jgi:hypothetical protein
LSLWEHPQREHEEALLSASGPARSLRPDTSGRWHGGTLRHPSEPDRFRVLLALAQSSKTWAGFQPRRSTSQGHCPSLCLPHGPVLTLLPRAHSHMRNDFHLAPPTISATAEHSIRISWRPRIGTSLGLRASVSQATQSFSGPGFVNPSLWAVLPYLLSGRQQRPEQSPHGLTLVVVSNWACSLLRAQASCRPARRHQARGSGVR